MRGLEVGSLIMEICVSDSLVVGGLVVGNLIMEILVAEILMVRCLVVGSLVMEICMSGSLVVGSLVVRCLVVGSGRDIVSCLDVRRLNLECLDMGRLKVLRSLLVGDLVELVLAVSRLLVGRVLKRTVVVSHVMTGLIELARSRLMDRLRGVLHRLNVLVVVVLVHQGMVVIYELVNVHVHLRHLLGFLQYHLRILNRCGLNWSRRRLHWGRCGHLWD